MAKLSYEIAEEIRKKYFSDYKNSTYKLAKEYGVAQKTIWSIVNRQLYKGNCSNYEKLGGY